MAQRLNRALEFMGWKVPEVEETESFEEMYDGTAVREVEFETVEGGSFTPVAAAPVTSGLRRISTVHPTSYADARLIGEAFREGAPVIINLTDLPDQEARRIVDFAAGLVFGLHGTIEKVTNRVFLLSPASVEVSAQTETPATPFFN